MAGGRDLVVTAPPGTGKTTRLPAALLGSTSTMPKSKIMVLQPRRVAARLAAARVAAELGEPLGGRIGYQVRFERVGGDATRLWFVTDGVFLRLLTRPGALDDVSVVIFDELHERKLDLDAALALTMQLRKERGLDLRLVVMSATIDPAPLLSYLERAVHLDVDARSYPVLIDHAPTQDKRPLDQRVAEALTGASEDAGDLLVFLPGSREIRRCEAHLRATPLATSHEILTLHGGMPLAEQARAVATPGPRQVDAGSRRRIILATNVAETSLTIPGVTVVVDSGLARQARESPWTGLKHLDLRPISRASAAQRAGRAGRVRPGRCLRLFTANDLAARPANETPEIERLALTDLRLLLLTTGSAAPRWFEPPPADAWAAADTLLTRLGALAPDGDLTPLGREMAGLGRQARLARVALTAREAGYGHLGAGLAALIEEGAPRSRGGDLFDPLEEAVSPKPRGTDHGREARLKASARQLSRRMGLARQAERATDEGSAREALTRALITGFPDQLGRVMAAGGARAGHLELLLANGRRARLPDETRSQPGDLLLALDAEERRRDGRPEVYLRAASPVSQDQVLEVQLDRVEERDLVRWDARRERALATRELRLDGLVLESTPWAQADPEALAACLFEAARTLGLAAFSGRDEDPPGLLARLAWLGARRPELELPETDAAGQELLLRALCDNKRSFAELRTGGVEGAILSTLPPGSARELERLAPAWIRLGGGRRLRVSYAPDKPPWVSSRLQDFFGMQEGPRILNGSEPVALHLLAPNRRAVQITTDLAGFWARTYPTVARELRRRYPRHKWPDAPLSASPPSPGRVR